MQCWHLVIDVVSGAAMMNVSVIISDTILWQQALHCFDVSRTTSVNQYIIAISIKI